MRARFLVSLLSALVLACSGGGSAGDENELPVGLPGTIPTPTTPAPGTTPPPQTQPEVQFDPRFIDLGKAGAYPSDLVTDSSGSLYTVDDAQIPATIVRYPASGGSSPSPTVALTAAMLIDHDGTQPATAPAALDFGGGLFGAFTGDLEVVEDRWLFVTVGAGNSWSTNNGAPLRLANLVLINAEQGTVVQTVDLAWPKLSMGEHSNGLSYTFIPQSLPSQVAFVPDPQFPGTGRLYVACSNGAGSSNGLSLWYHGTVQVWLVDFSKAQPLAPDLTARATTDVTRTYVSDHYNLVGLTHFRSDVNIDYLVLTDAGASGFDTNYVAFPETDAVLEFLDLQIEQWRPQYEINLGKILPSAQKIAIGRDSLGRSFGCISSQTYGAAYAVDLSGLDHNPVVVPDLRLLRTIELVPGGAQTEGSGFHPGVGLTASGRTLVVSTFAPASLYVVALPGDIENGVIAVNPAPFDTADLTAELSGGMGALVVPRNNDRDVYVLTNGTFDWTAFLPKDTATIATLTTRDRLP